MTTALVMEQINPQLLIKYEKNSRIHSEYQVKKIANSISAFGFVSPIIVDENNIVLAGHARLEAAKMLGLETVPIVRTTGLTEEKKRLFVIADNRLSEMSSWNMVMLMEEVNTLMGDFDIEGLGNFGIDESFLDGVMGTYTPNLKPTIDGRVVSNADIEKRKDKINTMFSRPQTEGTEVTCPNCGCDFYVQE